MAKRLMPLRCGCCGGELDNDLVCKQCFTRHMLVDDNPEPRYRGPEIPEPTISPEWGYTHNASTTFGTLMTTTASFSTNQIFLAEPVAMGTLTDSDTSNNINWRKRHSWRKP